MSIKLTSILVVTVFLGGWAMLSIMREALVQSSPISTPAAASLPRPGSPELHDLATQPRFLLENRTTIN